MERDVVLFCSRSLKDNQILNIKINENSSCTPVWWNPENTKLYLEENGLNKEFKPDEITKADILKTKEWGESLGYVISSKSWTKLEAINMRSNKRLWCQPPQ